MKKRLICLALAAVMLVLSACSAPKKLPPKKTADEQPSAAPAAPVETEKPLTIEDISIETQDVSVYDNDGSVLIKQIYDLVQIPERNAASREINECFLDDFEDYKDSHSGEYLEEDIEHAKNVKANYDGYSDNSFYYTSSCEITTLADGYLSVKYTTDWLMGGVHNRNHYGLTFDLNTGDEIDLYDIQQALPQGSNLLGFIHSMVYNYMETEGLMDRMFDNAVENTELDDYHFYLNDKEIVICTDTYLLADGAAGSFEIPLGIYIDNLSNTQLNA